jgi:hypothetical protein
MPNFKVQDNVQGPKKAPFPLKSSQRKKNCVYFAKKCTGKKGKFYTKGLKIG